MSCCRLQACQKGNTQLDESTASEENSAARQWEAKEGEPEEKSSKQWSRLTDVPTLMLGGMGKVTLASLSLMQPAGWVSCALAKHKQPPSVSVAARWTRENDGVRDGDHGRTFSFLK